MDAILRRDLQFLSLRMAATTTFIRLTGRPPDPRDFERMQQQLNDVAHALAMLAPIYTLDRAGGKPRQISEGLIGAGRLVRGGTALEMPDGSTCEDLRIQRRDCEDAIAILAGAGLPWKKDESGPRAELAPERNGRTEMGDKPYAPSDLTLIDVKREQDLDYWARTLETDEGKIRRAVEKVGPVLEKVKKELGIAGV